jgi:cell division protein FtsB
MSRAASNVKIRGRWPRLLGALLILLLAAIFAAPAAAGDGDERADELARQLEALRAEVAAMKAQMEAEKAAEEAKAEEMAQKPAPATDVAEIERRLDILAAEIEKLKIGEAAAEADRSDYGMGPAASKIYRTPSGLSIGGYGEALYQGYSSTRDDGTPSGRTDELDFLRAIFYFGYKFNDRWLFNSEIEYEHASSGAEGEVSVEFAYIDHLYRPELNFRFGLVLVPMGFLNELHEPTVFLGARRPDVERVIIPSTWRENGVGVFGDVGPWSYRSYVINGFDGSGFSASGLRGGRQKGSKAAAEDFAWVGRLDYTGTPGLLAGVSAYLGDSGQGITGPGGEEIGVGTTIYEGHLEWKWRGLELRGLATRAEVDDVRELNAALGLTGDGSVGEELEGYYLQLGYDLLARSAAGERALIPYLRYESYDTQSEVPDGFSRDPARDVESWTLGVAYRPIDRLIFKLDYLDYTDGADTAVDQLNVALGYVF